MSLIVPLLFSAGLADAATTTTFVSDLNPTSATNGHGPYERDRSNGGTALGDGGPIRLGGVTYAKGLGVHAVSSITYALNGAYDRFLAEIGVDDVVGTQGRVNFQVWTDNVLAYESGPLTGASPTVSAVVDVDRVNVMRLVVTDGGDGGSYDHADWASARLEVADGATTTTAPTTTAPTTTAPTTTSPTTTTTTTTTAPTTTNLIFTVAGNGSTGFSGDGGRATAAMINHPRGLAAMPDGGFVFAEAFGHRIRRVLPDGTIRTVAGTGVPGFSGDGGPATAARLNTPHAVVPMPDGSLLIADTNNFRIRRIAANGTITTVAGTGVRSWSGDGGPARLAQISAPRGLVATPDGGYLIADTDNHRVRKVSATGTITTVAGNGVLGFSGDGGPATSARLDKPFGISPIPGGFLVVDNGNRRVRRVLNGVITTVAGTGIAGFSGDGGRATSAQLNGPHSVVALPDGSFVIADALNNRIRVVAATGIISTVAGTGAGTSSGDGGVATAAGLNRPKAAIPFAGGLLIADADGARIRYVAPRPWPGGSVSS